MTDTTCDWSVTDVDLPDCTMPARFVHVPRYADQDQWTYFYCEKHRCDACEPLDVEVGND